MKNKIAGMLMVIALSGCGSRYVSWGKRTFKQADVRDVSLEEIRCMVSTADVYDEFNTVGHLSALWITPEVREFHRNLFAERRSLSEQDLHKMSEREERKSSDIGFYLLAHDDDQSDRPFLSLGNKQTRYVAVLRVDGKEYAPHKIKVTQLDTEYQAIFGKAYNQFRNMYHVRFYAHDKENRPVISDEAKTVELILRSMKHEIVLCWEA